jgi:hypothetical protein
MYIHAHATLLAACRTLFGQEILSGDFLDRLQPNSARKAFRNQAKAHHPDAYEGAPTKVRLAQTERFREIRQAYELISDFLETRHRCKDSRQAGAADAATPFQGRRTGPRRTRRKDQDHRPSVPAIPLEFGMYSYYRGRITYHQLIEALVWQRRQRPALGVIAKEWGWLSEKRIDRILSHRGYAVRFGRKAVELGYLDLQQVEALLVHQRSLQKPLGSYFIEQGLLTEEDAERIARDLAGHNSRVERRPGNHF